MRRGLGFWENTFGEIEQPWHLLQVVTYCIDHIKEDMSELASMPAGSHIGQLNMSWLYGDLPEQFLTRYDYDFLYQLKCTICKTEGTPQSMVLLWKHTALWKSCFSIFAVKSQLL